MQFQQDDLFSQGAVATAAPPPPKAHVNHFVRRTMTPAPITNPAQAKAKKSNDDPSQDGGWFWVDGLCYRDPEPLKPSGSCNGGRGTYEYYTGPDRMRTFIGLLQKIAAEKLPFVLDFETGPCQTAPVCEQTGEFDLTRLAYSTHTDPSVSGSDPHTSVVYLAAISIKPNEAHVIDVREALRLFPELFREALGQACTYGRMIAHNAVFECVFVMALTGVMPRVFGDTMIMTRILYAGMPDPLIPWTDPKAKPARLGADADSVFLREMGVHLEKRWQKFFLRLHPHTGLVQEMLEYVAGDVALGLELTAIHVNKLKKAGLYHLWTDFERPFIPLLAKNKYEGVPIDVQKVIAFRNEAAAEIEELHGKWLERNPEINHKSTDQILALFTARYPRRQIENVDEKALSELVEWETDEDARLILDLRQVERVHGTYLQPWIMTSRNPITRCIHCSFAQCDTATGRMSSASPNLQNIPSKSHWHKIRACFTARDGFLFVDRDLSQFEVRALASMACEYDMIAFFEKAWNAEVELRAYWGQHPEFGYKTEDALKHSTDPEVKRLLKQKKENDFHTLNAVAIYGEAYAAGTAQVMELQNRMVALGETHPEYMTVKAQMSMIQNKLDTMRKEVKSLTFGIPYGVSEKKVAVDFKISEAAAKEKIEKYYTTWSKIALFLGKCESEARYKRQGSSLTGRKRFYPKISQFDPRVQERLIKAFERQNKNFPIQSINGDVLKMASILMAPELAQYGASFRLWVHDEILIECPAQYANIVADIMERCMLEAAKRCGIHNCPIETSAEIGTCWSH